MKMAKPGVRENLLALALVKAVFVEAQGDHLRSSKCFVGKSLANAILLSFQRLSCKGIHENGKTWSERTFAGSCIGEGCLR